jgi:phenylalanine-4-hydroxylase
LERRLEEKEIVKLPDDFATLMTTCPTVTDPSVASYIDFLWRGWRRSVEEKAVLEIRCYFINEELRNMRKEALRE